MKQLEHPGVVAALLAVAVAVVLSGCWDAPFDRGDDRVAVLWAAEHSVGDLLRPQQSTCFPITFLSLKLDYALFGAPASIPPHVALTQPVHARLWSTGIRIMNGVYALLAGLALWSFLRRIGSDAALATLVALAWIVHPMSCESICWDVERKNVLTAMFGFFSLLMWTEDGLKIWRWPIVWALYALAVFSKASALGLLPVFAALEVLQWHRRVSSETVGGRPAWRWPSGRDWTLSIRRLIIPSVIAGAGMKYSSYAMGTEIVAPPGGNAGTALLTDVSIFGQYLQHIVAPLQLSFYYYVEPIVSLGDPRLWTYGLSMAAFLAVLIWLAGAQRPIAIFGIIWFFAALGPNSNVIACAFPMQDRYTFLGVPGMLLAIFLAVKNVFQRWFKTPLAAYAPLAAFILFLAVLTAKLSPLYADENNELALVAAERQPRSAFAHLTAAGTYFLRVQAILSGERRGNAQAIHENAEAALKHLCTASECPEFNYFNSPLEFQVLKAELYSILGDYPNARAVLDGWLPPQNMRMLSDHELSGREQLRTGYTRVMLISAWMVASNLNLDESSLPALSAERRTELCREALHAADEAAKLGAGDGALLLESRILLTLSRLETSMEIRRQRYDAAAEILKNLQGSEARELLAGATRP